MSSGVATRDKQGWHCVGEIERGSLITQRKTSPLAMDWVGTTWKVSGWEPEPWHPLTGRIWERRGHFGKRESLNYLFSLSCLPPHSPSAVMSKVWEQLPEGWGRARRCRRRMDPPHLCSLPGSPGQQPGPEAARRPTPHHLPSDPFLPYC